MSSCITATRRRHHWLASVLLMLCLENSGAQAQQPASADRLPPIEVSPPVDQNRTRAQPTSDESGGPRRAAPNTSPTNSKPAPGTGANVTSATASDGNGGRQFSGI